MCYVVKIYLSQTEANSHLKTKEQLMGTALSIIETEQAIGFLNGKALDFSKGHLLSADKRIISLCEGELHQKLVEAYTTG